MPLLEPEDVAHLQETFADLTEDVTLTVVGRAPSALVVPGQQADATGEVRQIIGELAATSPRLKVELVDPADDADRADELSGGHFPALVLSSAKSRGRLRYFGLPAGYEMSTLVAAVSDLGGAEPPLPDELVARLTALSQPVHLQVFVTPS